MRDFTLSNPIIKAEKICKNIAQFEQTLKILHQVSFEVKLGQSLAIIGPSGAGKTTLLGILAGLDTPTSGKVLLGGIDIFSLNEEQRTLVRAKNVSFIFQNFYLLDNLTALENVMLPLELHGIADAKSKALSLLEKVGLKHRLTHYPQQLSGGEQQRVALARAFVIEPKIIFADEPTGNLDQETANSIVKLLFDLNKNSNTTLVIVTHENGLAQMCNNILHLEKGEIY